MAAKKAKKQATARKPAGSTPRTRTNKQVRTKRSSPGLMSRAKKVVRTVVAGAAAGAATGAIQGAIESGKKATGLGQGGKEGSTVQGKK
jgi:hypothetical protein